MRQCELCASPVHGSHRCYLECQACALQYCLACVHPEVHGCLGHVADETETTDGEAEAKDEVKGTIALAEGVRGEGEFEPVPAAGLVRNARTGCIHRALKPGVPAAACGVAFSAIDCESLSAWPEPAWPRCSRRECFPRRG